MPEPIKYECIIDAARFEYPGYHRIPSFCRLRALRPTDADGILDPARPWVVIATDPQEPNCGTSITNRAEVIATLAWAQLERPQNGMFYIEHYPPRGVCYGGRYQFEESFDRVTFHWDAHGQASCPDWRRLSPASLVEMLGIGIWHSLTQTHDKEPVR